MNLAMPSLVGSLLVATPALVDPSFDRTVVLVLDQDDDGALGVVLNRPSPVAVAEVLPEWAEQVSEEPVMFVGGPVGTDTALALGRIGPGRTVSDAPPEGFRPVHGAVGLVDLDADPVLLAPHLLGLRLFAGHAGWAGGQLEREVAEDAWFVVPATQADPFARDAERLWREVLRRQGGELAWVSTAPVDPTMN